jgi:hypothetical protein
MRPCVPFGAHQVYLSGEKHRVMPKLRCEVFGHFIYAEELSYSALLDKETRLKEELARLLDDAGFVHLHFVSAGDFLLLQGAAGEYDQGLFHEVCDGVSRILDADVRARLLFVDRFLDSILFYALTNETWREACLDFPLPKAPASAARADPPAAAAKRRRRR